MFQRLKEHNLFYETIFLGVISLVCFGMSVFRFKITGSPGFLFLNWNLFLAFIPWLLSSMARVVIIKKNQRYALFVLLPLWLLFFPNSLYILTDLFHLKNSLAMPVWFDTMLILSFAWTGLLFGFLSLWNIERLLRKIISKKWVYLLSGFLLFLGSFGVYLGRFLRWNSWEIISEPMNIIYDVGSRIVNPFSHPRTWGMTFCLTFFLNMMYWSFYMIKRRNLTGNKLTK